MDITQNSHDSFGHAVLEVAGAVDVTPTLLDRIPDLPDGGPRRLVMGLTTVAFVDFTGPGVLVGTPNRAGECGGQPAPVCPRVTKRCGVNGLDAVFAMDRPVEGTVPGAETGRTWER